jgi:hypothetical protein
MWVPRTPKRADFCGCPPCPICFCWAGGDTLTDGMDKFAQDVLGEPRAPTAAEKKILDESAERIHVGNLERAKQPEVPLDREALIAAADEADRRQGMQRQMSYFLKQKRQEAEHPAPKPLNTITCDGMDLSYIEEEERRKKDPKPKELVFTGWENIGNSIMDTYMKDFERMVMRDMTRTMYGTSSFFMIDDSAKPSKLDASIERQPLTDKDRRRIQAEEEAKKRMKLQAREPVRR